MSYNMATQNSAVALQEPAIKVMPSSGARIALWRGLTLQGNLAFERGHDVRARQVYEEALAEADELYALAALRHDKLAIRLAPLLYTMSCNNIIELARRQNDGETMGIFLYRSFAKLAGVTEATQASLELRWRSALNLRFATRALVRHLEQQGSTSVAQAHAERARLAVGEVRRLARPRPRPAAASGS